MYKNKLIGENIPWLKALREEGAEAFRMPLAKDEAWKYDNLKELDIRDFDTSPQGFVPYPFAPMEGYIIHFTNGIFSPKNTLLPESVEVVPLIEKLIEGEGCTCHCEKALSPTKSEFLFNKNIGIKNHPFAALNTAFLQEGLFIKIAKNTHLDKPIIIVNHTDSNVQIMRNLRNIIILEEGAKAEMMEVFDGDGTYFSNIVNEVFLKTYAHLEHYKHQNDSISAYHISMTAVEVGKNAEYTYFCHQKGAKFARNELKAELIGHNAKVEINGTYLSKERNHINNTVLVEHIHPNTKSDMLFKAVFGGEAKGVFQGKISIGKEAAKAEGNMLHKALLLNDSAEVDCKPELEIFNEDVKCSHGAASGQLDEEQLFYMQSRGIDADDAKQLLIDAYLDDAFLKIKNLTIREWIKNHV